MDRQTASIPKFQRLASGWSWVAVLAILLFVGLIRVHLLTMPLERDEGEYAYAGQLILQGIPPYELVYNMKLPGTYFTYAAGMAVFGQTPSGIHLTLLVVNSLTSVFVFLLGRKLFGVAAGLVACLSFALLSLSPAVLGMAAHASQFVVVFAVLGTLIFWNATNSARSRDFFISGFLFGLAFLMEQPAVCFALFGLVCLLWNFGRKKTLFTRNFAARVITYSLGCSLPFAVVCLEIFLTGDFGRFWFWTIDYATSYVANRPFADGLHDLGLYLYGELGVYGGFWLVAVAGAGVMFARRKIGRETTFALAFLLFSFLGVTPGWYFRKHYFVILLPAFAIIVGMSVAALQSILSVKLKSLPLVVFLAAAAWSVYLQRFVFFRCQPRALSAVIYRGNPFLESLEVAQYIREHSPADGRIAVVGSEPEIYFYSHRHSATGYIYTYPLMESQPYATVMQHNMIGEIEANRPEYLVLVMYKLSWLEKKNSDTSIFRWVRNYTKQYYEPTVIAGWREDNQPVWFEGKDAKDYRGFLREFIIVYQRKPSAG